MRLQGMVARWRKNFVFLIQPQTLLRSCYALMLMGLTIVGYLP